MIFPWLFPWLFPCRQKCVESLSFVTGPIIKNPKVSLCDDAEHLAQRSAGVGRSIQSYREVSVLDAPPQKRGMKKPELVKWVNEAPVMLNWGFKIGIPVRKQKRDESDW